MFDRSHMEIQSISGQIERAQSHGPHETHEVYVNSVRMLDERRASAEYQLKLKPKQVCASLSSVFRRFFFWNDMRNKDI